MARQAQTQHQKSPGLRLDSYCLLQRSNVSPHCGCPFQSQSFIGLVLAVIDRTALWVARSANPLQFEDKIRESQRSEPKFSFLNPNDPYHEYYRHRIEKVLAGEVDETDAPAGEEQKDKELEAEMLIPEGAVASKEPHPQEFMIELPPISAVEL